MNNIVVILALVLLSILIGEIVFVCKMCYEDRLDSDFGDFFVGGCIVLSLLGLITALICMIINYIF